MKFKDFAISLGTGVLAVVIGLFVYHAAKERMPKKNTAAKPA